MNRELIHAALTQAGFVASVSGDETIYTHPDYVGHDDKIHRIYERFFISTRALFRDFARDVLAEFMSKTPEVSGAMASAATFGLTHSCIEISIDLSLRWEFMLPYTGKKIAMLYSSHGVKWLSEGGAYNDITRVVPPEHITFMDMNKTIVALTAQVEKLTRKVEKLTARVYWAPGGPGAEAAREDFAARLKLREDNAPQ